MNPVDLTLLRENLEYDEELMKEIIDMYIELFPSQIESLREAIEKLNYDKIKSYAHDIKGTVSNFKAERALKLAYSIEIDGKNKELTEETKKNFTKLQSELQKIKYFLINLNFNKKN